MFAHFLTKFLFRCQWCTCSCHGFKVYEEREVHASRSCVHFKVGRDDGFKEEKKRRGNRSYMTE